MSQIFKMTKKYICIISHVLTIGKKKYVRTNCKFNLYYFTIVTLKIKNFLLLILRLIKCILDLKIEKNILKLKHTYNNNINNNSYINKMLQNVIICEANFDFSLKILSIIIIIIVTSSSLLF